MSAFTNIDRCWVCDGTVRTPVHDAVFELSIYREQDPELAAYTGARVSIARCDGCGFAQPERLPALDRYFDRMYDQRWSDRWVADEYEATYKDRIFAGVLAALARRLPPQRRRLLDVGAHAGRFLRLAREAGWEVEGIELNPKTAAFAAAATGVPVHQVNVHQLDPGSRLFDAVTITDVLEHVPAPLPVLRRLHALLNPGGWVAVKVPNAPAQRVKERVRARVQRGYRPALADNLVHVNHFSPGSLRLALERAGFTAIAIEPAAPELSERGAVDRAVRLSAFTAARLLPGAIHTPLALNLQAYGRRD